MADASFSWDGDDPYDLAASLGEVEEAAMKRVTEAIEEWTLRVEASAKRKVPVDSGRLKSKISHKAERQGKTTIVGAVGSNLSYAPHVELGTDPHTITGSPLAWKTESGDMAFATTVQHPGTEAQPYLRPAVEENRDELERLVSGAIEAAVDDVS